MKKLPEIALIEFDSSHHECLHSQVLFLKDYYSITLIINQNSLHSILNNNDLKEVIKINPKEHKTVKNILYQKNIQKVILNSAERKTFRFIISCIFDYKIQFWGILHNPNRLRTSLKQKIISHKLKGYFVLSDFIKSNTKINTKTPIESIYLIYPKQNKTTQNITKPKDETWIVIPGRVEFKRRDYDFLLNLKPVKKVKFIILGNINSSDGFEFNKKISAKQLKDNFIFFNHYVEEHIFNEYMQLSDFILPLIHSNNEYFNKYISNKITGAYNLAYQYEKTILLENSLKKINEFKEIAYFYDFLNFQSLLNLIFLDKKKYENPKWDFKYQQKKYMNFISE